MGNDQSQQNVQQPDPAKLAWSEARDRLNKLADDNSETLYLIEENAHKEAQQAFWRVKRALGRCGFSPHEQALIMRKAMRVATEPRATDKGTSW